MARQAATSRKPVRPKASVAVRPSSNAAKVTKAKVDTLTPEQQIASLQHERDKLLARVVSLEGEVTRLKDKQSAVIDRVAWALDSLRDVLGERT